MIVQEMPSTTNNLFPHGLWNETTAQWDSPIARPEYEDGTFHEWNEDTQEWEKIIQTVV